MECAEKKYNMVSLVQQYYTYILNGFRGVNIIYILTNFNTYR